MPFLFLNNTNIQFAILKKLIQRYYIIVKILFITSQVKFINKKKFTKIKINKNFKIFIIFMIILKFAKVLILLLYVFQIIIL